MENLHKYIQEARQHGHSDEHIHSSLTNAGWHPDQVTEAINRNNQPQPAKSQKPKSNKRKRLLGVLVVIVFAIIVSGISIFAIHKHGNNNQLSSADNQPLGITLYYSDGHTVLWQGNNLNSPAVPASNNSAFIKLALNDLKQQYGGGRWQHDSYKVVTTLNLNLQNLAEQDVQNNSTNVATVGGNEQAMVAEDVKTGQIVAYIGNSSSANTQYGQNDYADTLLSPGSTMMPFVYAAQIQNNTNVGAGSVISDTEQPLPGYPCTNTTPPYLGNGGNCLFDNNDTYPGQLTIRYALGGSRNVPAVEASLQAVPNGESSDPPYVKSFDKWISMANSAIGIKDAYGCYPAGISLKSATASQQTQCYEDAALGGGDITLNNEINGDATLARLGQEIPETYILSIAKSGKTVYQWSQPKATQVYSSDTAYIIDNILDDPNATYLTPYQKFQNYNGWDIAVKTGTEDSSQNGLMNAWSSQYAVIGLAGSDTLTNQLQQGHFEDITEPITKTWMEQALDALHTSPVNWTQPSDIQTLPSFAQTSFQDYGAVFPGPSTDIYPSWYK